ncbi:MAG TPA: glycosyltransferase, partial [Solirubrobacteraceae bacterium]|nr:glycosyltransferase [Solirubrobacteraceae bacterium]
MTEGGHVDISAIIVNRDAADLLRACLRSMEAALDATAMRTELVVVDNASTDDSREMVAREFPGVRLIALERNVGFPAGVNAGIERTTGRWIALLNNDATIDRDALRQVFARPIPPDVGTIALQMRFVARPDLVNSAGLG